MRVAVEDRGDKMASLPGPGRDLTASRQSSAKEIPREPQASPRCAALRRRPGVRCLGGA